MIAKLFFLLSSKQSWKEFDKRVFYYFYDNTAATAIEPYINVLMNGKGARDRNSWISKQYLSKKGIDCFDFI